MVVLNVDTRVTIHIPFPIPLFPPVTNMRFSGDDDDVDMA